MSRAMDKAVGLVKGIAQDVEAGATIVREIRPQELRAVWTNTTTQKEYAMGANVLRRLIDFDKKDPRIIPVLQFIADQITAPEASRMIDRLNNLKAFW